MKKIKTLIVEDVTVLQKMISRIIKSYAEVTSIDNGVEAIYLYTKAILNDDPYDLICLDIYIPEMNGLEVLQNIRKFEEKIGLSSENRVKIIVITSLANNESFEREIKKYADSFLNKPFSPADLTNELNKYFLIKENV